MSEFKIDVNALSPVEKELRIVAPEALIREKIQSLFDELAEGVQLKGFRKGKAPRKVVERMYMKRVMRDAEADIIQDGYVAAVEEAKIHPLSAPRITREDYPGSGDYAFTIVVETRPEIESVNLDGIVVEKERLLVKDEAVDAELERRRDQAAVMRTVEDRQVVEDNDWVTLSYSGFDGDTALTGAKTEKQLTPLADRDFIPGFKEGILGQTVGQPFEFTVTFPTDFHVEELRGKPIRFEAEIHDIQRRELPELDDAFARDMGDYETLDQLRVAVREQMEETEKARVEREFRGKLWDAVIAANPIPLPTSVVLEQTRYEQEDFARQLASYGIDPKKMNVHDPKMEAGFVAKAESTLRGLFISEKLAQDWEIKVGDAEFDAYLNTMAEQMGYPIEQVQSYFSSESRKESALYSLRQDRILDALTDKVTVREVDPKPKEAPAQEHESCEDPGCATCADGE